MEKSHVGMGHKICPVCGEKHDEVVLLDRRFQKTLERDMFIGYELCPKHTAEAEEHDAVFLVETTSDKKSFTGGVARITKHVADEVFNIPLGTNKFVFCETGVLEKLQNMVEK